ncbi:hypothetical protein L1987_61459 [Smallanthus sonchifolius]|uniref:Uncharacterized protein n=1 Tax=Smallanthus sonchifolius TaxID=185202 RepID=A0ACB9C7S7_9ASTR|nr:hypothetical protein L1987_61459 [Smallanthus sonchifolius]
MNSHRVHDYITDILACSGGTFVFKGMGLLKTSRVCTANPLDIHHILSKNFNNYPRGDTFRQIFDVLGDGFSNTDGEVWEFHHNTIMSLLKSPSFQTLLEDTIWDKVEKGLMPVLEYVYKQEVEVDLQDIFQRFAFDTISKLLFDSDPKSLSLDLPSVPCEKALSEIEEAIMKSYAWKTVDQFIYKSLAEKQKEFISEVNSKTQEDKFSTAFLKSYQGQSGSCGDPNKFLRDTLLNLVVAGRDTNSSALSWLFYLLSRHPMVEDKILEELHTQLNMKKCGNLKDLQAIDLQKLVYLHGALCEALRLFPRVPFQVKTPSQPDILPSGRRVDHNTTVILSFYSMGRMKSI